MAMSPTSSLPKVMKAAESVDSYSPPPRIGLARSDTNG